VPGPAHAAAVTERHVHTLATAPVVGHGDGTTTLELPPESWTALEGRGSV